MNGERTPSVRKAHMRCLRLSTETEGAVVLYLQ